MAPRWGGLRPDPYDPDAQDADADGIVQEGTAWERPAGTRILLDAGEEIGRGLTADARPAGARIVDRDGNDVDYSPTWLRAGGAARIEVQQSPLADHGTRSLREQGLPSLRQIIQTDQAIRSQTAALESERDLIKRRNKLFIGTRIDQFLKSKRNLTDEDRSKVRAAVLNAAYWGTTLFSFRGMESVSGVLNSWLGGLLDADGTDVFDDLTKQYKEIGRIGVEMAMVALAFKEGASREKVREWTDKVVSQYKKQKVKAGEVSDRLKGAMRDALTDVLTKFRRNQSDRNAPMEFSPDPSPVEIDDLVSSLISAADEGIDDTQKEISAIREQTKEKALKQAAESVVSQEKLDRYKETPLTSFLDVAFPGGVVSEEEDAERKRVIDKWIGGLFTHEIVGRDGKKYSTSIEPVWVDTRATFDEKGQAVMQPFFFIKGTITDSETGENAGFFERVLEVDGSIKHSVLFLNEDRRNSGLGSIFVAATQQMYGAIGVDTIKTTGVSSTTGYKGATHWAKMGFDWENESSKRFFIDTVRAATLEKAYDKEYFDTPEQAEEIRKLLDQAQEQALDDSERIKPGDLLQWRGAEKWFQESRASVEYKKSITTTVPRPQRRQYEIPRVGPSGDEAPANVPQDDEAISMVDQIERAAAAERARQAADDDEMIG